jgi:hypothetical protein
MNVFTVTMGMDTSQDPARIAAVYGNQKYTPGGRWGGRQHTGELYLKWFDGASWASASELVSEPRDERAWYPSISQDVSNTFGVLYLKGQPNGKIFELRFALFEPTSRNELD